MTNYLFLGAVYSLLVLFVTGSTCSAQAPLYPNAVSDTCTSVFGSNSMKPVHYEDGNISRLHTKICLGLKLTDSGGSPVEAGTIKVIAKVFYRPYVLDHVDPFRPVPHSPGFYVGILPIDDRDELDLFSLIFTIPGYDTVTVPPRHLSRANQFPEAIQIALPRNLTHWRPRFSYDKVPDDLNKLLSKPLLFLNLRGRAQQIPDFSGKLGSNSLDDISPEFVLAKASALNMFYVLHQISGHNGAPDWLSMVTKIVAIGQERLIATVQPSMFSEVKRRLDSSQNLYNCVSDREANSSLHGKNFAGYYQSSLKSAASKVAHTAVVSLKSPECRGNLQITVGKFTLPDGTVEVLADIDFDDHFDFLHHMSDVVEHVVLGQGTNPMLVFEYLKAKDHSADLAYSLELRLKRTREPQLSVRP